MSIWLVSERKNGMKKRLSYIDVLNCIAIFFVLVLHSSQLAHFGNNNYTNFKVTGILQCLCIPAVYIFFMNSGATLLNYRDRQNTVDFFAHRIRRVLIPFLFWTVFYYFFDIRFSAFPGPIRHYNPGIRDFINSFTHNEINNTFWFFYAILALYLVTPIFSLLIDKHKRLLMWIVIGYFIFNDVFDYLQNLIHITLLTRYTSQPIVSSSFLGYFILGYLIREKYLSKKIENWIIGLGISTLALNVINAIFNNKFFFLANIGPFLYSVALYLIIMRGVGYIRNPQILKLFALLSTASLGVYILHPLFYAVFDKVILGVSVSRWDAFLKGVLTNPNHIFIMPVVTYIVLAIILLLVKKIRIINYIIP